MTKIFFTHKYLPERGGLELVRDARVGEGLVAAVRGQGLAQEGRQVLVGNDVLQAGDVEPPGALEEVLV